MIALFRPLPRCIPAALRLLILFACVSAGAQTITAAPMSSSPPAAAADETPSAITPGQVAFGLTYDTTALVGGKNFSATWTSQNADTISYACTGGAPGFPSSGTVATANGKITWVASDAWAPYTERCTWTATSVAGEQYNKTRVVVLTTVAGQTQPPPPPPPHNDAQVLGASAPSTMQQGQSYTASVTVKNTGNTTWPAGSAYRLGAKNPPDNTIWGAARVALNNTVAPGQQGTISFAVVAPAAGSYSMQWGMLQEGVEWFGGTSSAAVTVSAAAVAPTVTVTRTPSPMVAGQPFTLTWSSTNATSLARNCSASGTGYTVSDAPASSGSVSGAASSAWVNYPSTCRWAASGAGGTATYTETMATNGPANGDAVTYIHTDGLGSPVARSDQAGKLISTTRYEPYGLTAGGVVPTIGFAGHVNDADTGLVYMQQRYYDPVAGRFLSIDPVTTDASTGSGFNRYAYANNSPYKYLDPDGRNGVLVGVVTGGAVLMIGAWKYATAPQARAVINRIFASIGSSSNASTAVGQGCNYCVPSGKTNS